MYRQSSRRSRGRVSMTTLLLLGLVGFLLWASLFEIDQAVRAQGQVIASSRTQIIQAADGGVLSEILVQEGQSVAAGERLAILERKRPKAAFEESRAKEAALATALTRAEAEASGQVPRFGDAGQQFPVFAAVQTALYAQRKRSLQEEMRTLQDGLALAQEELQMNEALLATGDTSRLEVMRAKRQVGELQGKLNAMRNKYLQDARLEASKLAEELSSSRYKLEERQSILDHTELNAPVAGVVKYLKVSTIGGVLRAGDELMHISPSEDDLLIEIKVNPVDIGQLKPGLPVTLKLDAFDYSVYGTLNGTLIHISSDTLTEQGPNGQTTAYYRAQVRPSAEQLNPKLAQVPLKPGMTATADIMTDRRTILQYLAKPVLKGFSGALSER